MYESLLKDGRKTWALMPVNRESTIVDATYLPDEKGLLILLDSKKESFIDRPVQLESGEYKRRRDGSYLTREAKLETYKEHFLTNQKEIQDFVEAYVVNYTDQPLFEKPTVDKPATA